MRMPFADIAYMARCPTSHLLHCFLDANDTPYKAAHFLDAVRRSRCRLDEVYVLGRNIDKAEENAAGFHREPSIAHLANATNESIIDRDRPAVRGVTPHRFQWGR